MKILKKYLAVVLAFVTLAFAGVAAAQEAPDALVKHVSQEVIDGAKANSSIQSGNQQHIFALVEEKIIPHVDFDRMTKLAAGRNWNTAT
ncbi:MAG: ABC transporter substrate-binding protein, partial [Glaciimonas sp.]|nr:ABC transporter substrate-binding protein [Glaciimonas sp.]